MITPEVKSILGYCRGPGTGVFAADAASRRQSRCSRPDYHVPRAAKGSCCQPQPVSLYVCDFGSSTPSVKPWLPDNRPLPRIAQQVDLVVVVGGRNSANSSRLAEIARTAGRRVVFVERAAEVPRQVVASAGRVGVVAGSSTPSRVVREIVDTVRNPAKEA